MDDLLDLNWSSPASSNVKQPTPKVQKPKDAFADLLSTTPKPVDTSKLSLIEQQQLQQQQQQQRQQQQSPSGSSWLTPTQATTPTFSSTPLSSTPISATPVSSGPKYAHSSQSSFLEHKQSSTTASSFEDMLNPFGGNTKRAEQGRNTPLNQL